MTEVPETITYEDISAFCAIGPRPRYLTGALRWILINHFSTPSYIEQEQLADYTWNEDENISKILIESVHRWNVKNIQQRPALYIKRNPVRPQSIAISDGMMQQLNPDDGEWPGEYKTKAVVGSHTVFCVGQTSGESEALGQEVFQELLEFGPVIKQDFNLHAFEVMELSAAMKIEEAREHFMVPVVCSWAYFNAWRLKPLTPIIKTITIDAIY